MPDKKTVEQVFNEVLASNPTSICDFIDEIHLKRRELSTDAEKLELYHDALDYIYGIISEW